MSDPVKSTKVYWAIFFALIGLTILTVAQSRIEGLGHTLNRTIGIIVACTKASLVALFFMHLKYEKRYFYPVVLFPLVLVLVIIFSNFPDIAFGEHTTPGVETRTHGGGGH